MVLQYRAFSWLSQAFSFPWPVTYHQHLENAVPVEQARFVNTDDILVNFTKATFTMEQSVPWTSLATGWPRATPLMKVFLEVSDYVVFVVKPFLFVMTFFYLSPCSGLWWCLPCRQWCWRTKMKSNRWELNFDNPKDFFGNSLTVFVWKLPFYIFTSIPGEVPAQVCGDWPI